jgi:hypothetical protein
MGIFGRKVERVEKGVELGTALFKRIDRLLSAHPGEDVSTRGIAHFQASDSQKQYLEIVGESFCQEDIKAHFKPDKWAYGLLVPEPTNSSDPNAIAIYLITRDFAVVRVGYLKKEMAKKVSRKISSLLVNDGLVIPVLAIVKKKENSENWAIVGYAMTDFLQFS